MVYGQRIEKLYTEIVNKKLIIIAVAILAVLGGGYYFYSSQKGGTGASGTQSAVSSLKDLIAKNIPQTCTFSDNQGGVENSGTMYMAGGKVRGDFESKTTDGKTAKSHMIEDGNTSYIWSDDSNMGFKSTFDSKATSAPGVKDLGTPSETGSFDASAGMNYKCSAWSPDASKFALPKGVTFQSFGVPSIPDKTSTEPGAAAPSNSSQCSYCDSLTGDSLAQCKAALNCK